MGDTILIIEDDKSCMGMLVKCFTMAGFTVYAAGTCEEAIKLAGQYLPDCFLFDYHLGAGTCVPACLFVRGHDRLKNAPIVMLSGDIERAVGGYEDCQADVFLYKGASCREILAAMRRQLRRASPGSAVMRQSDLTLDLPGLRILREGRPAVSLSSEQFRLFFALFNRSPQFVNEEELLGYVFIPPGSHGSEALTMLAHRLRVKLGRQQGRRIRAVKGRGWIYLQPRSRDKRIPAPLKNGL